MPRVIGIDPGTISIDMCGLDDGHVFLERSLPTADALADPATLLQIIDDCSPVDLVAGPSGYGLPLVAAQTLSEQDIRLAYLSASPTSGGIRGLGGLLRALAASSKPVVLTPGVIHLPSVPAFRKVNRIDMGTADKVCATALALREHVERHACAIEDASFIMLELGGAFSAAIAVHRGKIVDGIGGTAGPLGFESCGALDGEVACLAGTVSKQMLFGGGVRTVAAAPAASIEEIASSSQGRLAWSAYIEGAAKAAAALCVAIPEVQEIVLSGRVAHIPAVRESLTRCLAPFKQMRVHVLNGLATTAKHAAQGAALIADGLAGGASAPIVESLGIRDASGTVLDHLYVISPAHARAVLGLA